jgi:hypothetical protein
VLPDLRVLTWSRLETPQLWDPAANTFTPVPVPTWIFCSGMTLLADGRVFVPGGHISDGYGLPDANIFDPVTSKWTALPPMQKGRWYPTSVALPDGSVVVAAGAEEDGTQNPIAEVFQTDGTWRALTSAPLTLPYYPWFFVAPDGRVFVAGAGQLSRFLDTRGTGRWITGPTSNYGPRSYGSAVMYEPGKILMLGGNEQPPTNTAEVIDLNSSAPAWRYTSPMAIARRQMNATVLPDGKVLVIGGTSGVGFNDEANAVYYAEFWDPATETWTQLPSQKRPRVYHSTAFLMADGRVLSGGGGEGGSGTDEFNVEMYSPAYLFKSDGSLAARPTIGSAPASANYGATISVSSPQAASISRVTLIRLGAVTHTFNANQRLVQLQFTKSGDSTLTVTTPASPNVAPPGHYMLFLLDAAGVPSVARVVRLDLP